MDNELAFHAILLFVEYGTIDVKTNESTNIQKDKN